MLGIDTEMLLERNDDLVEWWDGHLGERGRLWLSNHAPPNSSTVGW